MQDVELSGLPYREDADSFPERFEFETNFNYLLIDQNSCDRKTEHSERPIPAQVYSESSSEEEEAFMSYVLVSSSAPMTVSWPRMLSGCLFACLTNSFSDQTTFRPEQVISAQSEYAEIKSRTGSTVWELCCAVPMQILSTLVTSELEEIGISYFISVNFEAKSTTQSPILLDVLFLAHCTNNVNPLSPQKKLIPVFPGRADVCFLTSCAIKKQPTCSEKFRIVLDSMESSATDLDVSTNISLTTEKVLIVNRHDMIAETNGARGGRPVHRLTGQLLMTREQVQKVLQIRARWQGLSPRQRRDNVHEEDFYPFLTLNRDETAQCLGVCATWLKDAIRAQGMITWPGRPLRRSGAYLQSQKELLESSEARLYYTSLEHPDRDVYRQEIIKLKRCIENSVAKRTDIVRKNVSEEYFRRFIEKGGPKFLNPTWNALPPTVICVDR